MDRRNRLDTLRRLLQGRANRGPQQASATDCLRLCAGLADGLPGLIVDQLGPLLVAVDYQPSEQAKQKAKQEGKQEDEAATAAEALLASVRECRPGRHVVVKVRALADGRNRFHTASFAPDGGARPLVGSELGLRFEIRTDPAHDFGLFLDAAKARAFVRGAARGQRVLNLFSYTGAFGVAAAAGGATEVTNVDPNRDYLAWSLRNAELNGVRMRVLPDTAQDHLAKHLRRASREPGRGYDLVIVDPPAFGVGRGKERVLRLLWPTLFESLRTMKPRRLLLMCNDKAYRSRQSFAEQVEDELGRWYRFQRLGTCLTAADLDRDGPSLAWREHGDDPFYAEPAVLGGTRGA